MQMRLRILINGNWVDLTPEDAVTLHADLQTALHVGLAPPEPQEAAGAPLRLPHGPAIRARDAADAPLRPAPSRGDGDYAEAPPLTDPAWQTSVPHVVSLDPPTVATDPVGRFRPTARKPKRAR